jgi:hypothetical protein
VHHRHQIVFLASVLLLASGCGPLLPKLDDFPEPRVTPIVEFPTMPAPSHTPRPVLKAVFADDLNDASTFFLILKVGVAAGNSGLIAEHVLYPIEVNVNGQPTTLASPAEFERAYEGIFASGLGAAIAGADEADLELTLDGIKAAGGTLWFNQFCADALCSQGEFLITRINN